MSLEKLKYVLEQQIPELYREEFPMFQEFLKQYYIFLESTYAGKLEHIRDIDSSLSVFKTALKNDLAKNIPQFGKLSDADFLKFAKNFYSNRGNEDSYKFLFRAMYGKELDMMYPSQYILRASAGKWQQDVTILIQVSKGNITDIIGNKCIIQTSNGTVSVQPENYIQISGSLYRVSINRLYTGTWSVGSNITLDDIFTGTIVSTPKDLTILQGGSGFKRGDVIKIAHSSGSLQLRVREISGSTVTKVEIVSAVGSSSNTTFLTITNAGSGTETSSIPSSPPASSLVISVNVGSFLNYPGYYSDISGFLSNANVLQGKDFNQQFSYVLKLEEQVQEFIDLIKRLLHPAGTALWVQYNLSNNFTLDPALESNVNRGVNLVERITIAETIAKSTAKIISDTVSFSESFTFTTGRVFSEGVSISESGSAVIQATQDYASQDYIAAVAVDANAYATGGTNVRTW